MLLTATRFDKKLRFIDGMRKKKTTGKRKNVRKQNFLYEERRTAGNSSIKHNTNENEDAKKRGKADFSCFASKPQNIKSKMKFYSLGIL